MGVRVTNILQNVKGDSKEDVDKPFSVASKDRKSSNNLNCNKGIFIFQL